jgi:hypothetical protein
MVLKLLELLVLHIIPTSVHLVLVIFTKLVICAAHVLLVELEKDKQRRVLQQLIVYVHRILVLVQMVQLPLVQLVLQMVPVFVRPVLVDITKMVIVVLGVDLLVVLGI